MAEEYNTTEDETTFDPTTDLVTDPTNQLPLVESDPSGTEAPLTEPSMETLEARITKMEETSKPNETPGVTAADLLAVPGVRDALQRHQNGTPEPVVDPPKPVEDSFTEPEDWNDLDNRQVAAAAAKMAASEVASLVEKQLRPLQEQQAQLSAYARKQEEARVKLEVDTLAKTAKDLDSLKPDMMRIHGGNPELSVEELYLIASKRAGKPLVPQRGVESERPSTTTIARPPRVEPRTSMPPITREQKLTASFDDAVGAALRENPE